MKIIRSKAKRMLYSYDATQMVFEPDGVVIAEDVKDVVEAVKYCLKEHTFLIPRGAGTGFTGGSLAVKGGIVLSLEKMNRILDIDPKNMFALVEPGVITEELQKAAEEAGLMYPPDPSSLSFCTIGGNIAENAGGPKAVKYGVTGDYVYGVEVVTGKAEVINFIKKVKKNATWYNVPQLFVGSEGTLGVITKALLKLIPKPETSLLFLILFNSLKDAAEFVYKVVSSGIPVCALELMDRSSILCVSNYKKDLNIPSETQAVIIAEVDGNRENVEKEADKLLSMLKGYRCNVTKATEDHEKNTIWDIRRAISPSLMHIAPDKINEDICVPVSELADAFEGIKTISDKYGIPIICYGHAGDGNIHVNIMIDKTDKNMLLKAQKATEEIFLLTSSLGGVLSGEHGIGISKARYIPIQMGKEHLHIMRRIKAAFDPDMIFNPFKMNL